MEAKIEHSKTMRDKFIQMRPLLKDRNVISDCETQIKEYQKYIDYFTEELHRLEARSSTIDTDTEKPASDQRSDLPPRSSSMVPSATVLPNKDANKKKYSNLGKIASHFYFILFISHNLLFKIF